MTDLPNCPFCDGEAVQVMPYGLYQVKCKNCGSGPDPVATQKEAVNRWCQQAKARASVIAKLEELRDKFDAIAEREADRLQRQCYEASDIASFLDDEIRDMEKEGRNG